MKGKEIIKKLNPARSDLPGRIRLVLESLVDFVGRVAAEFSRDNGLIRASGMAYSSLLALVPLTVVVFSFISAFGALDSLIRDIQNALVNFLVPTQQDQILRYVRQFTENARTLGLVGFVFFTITSILLLSTIENHFNEIWGARIDKSLGRRLTVYTSVLVLGTLLIAASFSASAALDNLVGSLPQIELLVRFVRVLFPMFLILLAFLLMIKLVPSAKIELRSALVGAVSGAFLWIAVQRGFAAWANMSVRNSVIYGSLALIPIFLIWLYLAWIIIIIALEITYVHQQIRKSSSENYIAVESDAERILIGASLFLAVAHAFHRGEQPLSSHEISKRFSISPTEITRIAGLFEERGLLISLEEPRWAYLPARSLSRIALRDLFRALLGEVKPQVHEALSDERRILEMAGEMSEQALAGLDNLTVEDIMEDTRSES